MVVGGGVKTSTGITRVFTGVLADVGTAVGKAMQDGKVGEYIKIRNIDSQRILVAKVNSDRTVEPVF